MIQKITLFLQTATPDVRMFGICIMIGIIAVICMIIAFILLAVLRMNYYKEYTKRNEQSTSVTVS